MAAALAAVSGATSASALFSELPGGLREQSPEAGHGVMRDCSLAASDNRRIYTRVGVCQVRPTISTFGIEMQARRLGGPAGGIGANRKKSISTWATIRPDGTLRALEGLTLGSRLRDVDVGNPRCLGLHNLEPDLHPSELL